MSLDDLYSTESSSPGDVGGRDGVFRRPESTLDPRQMAHVKHEIHSCLRGMLHDPGVDGDGGPAPSLDHVSAAANMLISFPDADEAMSLFGRVAEFVRMAHCAGEDDPGVRSRARDLMAELEAYADFDFWSRSELAAD